MGKARRFRMSVPIWFLSFYGDLGQRVIFITVGTKVSVEICYINETRASHLAECGACTTALITQVPSPKSQVYDVAMRCDRDQTS